MGTNAISRNGCHRRRLRGQGCIHRRRSRGQGMDETGTNWRSYGAESTLSCARPELARPLWNAARSRGLGSRALRAMQRAYRRWDVRVLRSCRTLDVREVLSAIRNATRSCLRGRALRHGKCPKPDEHLSELLAQPGLYTHWERPTPWSMSEVATCRQLTHSFRIAD